jgi:peptidylprolyl isomerase
MQELEDNVFKWRHILLAVIFILGVMLMSCNSTAAVAKNGDTVQVNYTGKLADGTVFDSSVGRDPLEFTLGKEEMIPGFEKAVLGMKVGEKKTVTIPSDEAYGPHLDDMVIKVSRDRIHSDNEPAVGQVLTSTAANGQEIRFTIIAISDNGTVTLDANHPLAGKDLTFDIELVTIK